MLLLRRRTLLIGSLLAGLAGAIAVIAFRTASSTSQRLADAGRDYLAGRVTTIDGWIMADSEARVILDQGFPADGSRTGSQEPAGSEAPPTAPPGSV